MILPHEIHALHDRDSEDLRGLAAHIAGILAQRDGCDESAAVFQRIGDRLAVVGASERRAAA
jgi:hypothetical protein